LFFATPIDAPTPVITISSISMSSEQSMPSGCDSAGPCVGLTAMESSSFTIEQWWMWKPLPAGSMPSVFNHAGFCGG